MGCASSKPTDHADIKLEESTGVKDAPHPPTPRTLGKSASFIQACGDRRNPDVAQMWDPHPCSPVPDGHYLLLKSEALRRVLPDYADARGGCCPKSLSQRPMKELVERGKGFRKGLVQYFDRDAFVVVKQKDIPKYRFAWLSFSCAPRPPCPGQSSACASALCG